MAGQRIFPQLIVIFSWTRRIAVRARSKNVTQSSKNPVFRGKTGGAAMREEFANNNLTVWCASFSARFQRGNRAGRGSARENLRANFFRARKNSTHRSRRHAFLFARFACARRFQSETDVSAWPRPE
jgi:hypothetical protein